MRGALRWQKPALISVTFALIACRSPAPEATPSADDRAREKRRCEEFVVRDWGPRPEHAPLASCQPGADAACGEGAVCVTWEGTSACAFAVDDPGSLALVAEHGGLVVIAHAGTNLGLDGVGQCAAETPEAPVTTQVNKRDVLRLSRVEGERLAGLLCRRGDGAQPKCDLPIHQSYRLVGYYHPAGSFPAGATFEVLHAEPQAP